MRDNFQSRRITTKINQLRIEDPKQVHFVGWSDAALANRRDLRATGGSQQHLPHRAPLTFISWRSSKLPRKARSSLAAETETLAASRDRPRNHVLPVDLKKVELAVGRIPTALVIDAKALYMTCSRRKISTAQVQASKTSLHRSECCVCWNHSAA